jgi:hypothetical protein
MHLDQAISFLQFLSESSENAKIRRESQALRLNAIASMQSGGFYKKAFDTRRINQETDFNPRRGLQNYHRSEQFLSEAQSQKIAGYARLKNIVDQLKEKYGSEPEWQDSYCRVLLNTLNTVLRTEQQDGDYGETGTSIGSFDYLDQLLHARYRLEMNSLTKLGEEQLREIVLSKDEPLIRKNLIPKYEITKRDVATQSYDALIDKLFNGVRASKENRSVQRTVTITIKDDYLDEPKE